MAHAPITISLTEEPVRSYVEARVDSGAYGTPTDYIQELVLQDRDRHLARLEEHLLEALKGEPIELTDEEWEHGDIVAIAEERLGQRS